jgi:PAS domain S-box-containing protein/putative nucleotidyltransferase with HDIG domain
MTDNAQELIAASEEKYRRLFEAAQDGILILDFATGKITEANPFIERLLGYPKAELLGKELWEIGAVADKVAAKTAYDTVKSAGYVRYTNLPLVARDGQTRHVEFVSNSYPVDGIMVIQCNIRDESQRIAAEQRIAALEQASRQTNTELVNTLATLIESRDPYTAGHLLRVSHLAMAIASDLGMSPDSIEGVRVAAMLHDIGKIGVPMEILVKPSKLMPFETALLMHHAQAGYEILRHINFPWHIAEIVRQHHERMDGSGYPRGLKGEEILREARIIAVADTVEALSTNRPFRPGVGITEALALIEGESGTRYDPAVVTACLTLFRDQHYLFPASGEFIPRFIALSSAILPPS